MKYNEAELREDLWLQGYRRLFPIRKAASYRHPLPSATAESKFAFIAFWHHVMLAMVMEYETRTNHISLNNHLNFQSST